MNGLKNFLQYLSDNWTGIMVCIGIIVGIVNRTLAYLNKSNDLKLAVAKQQIKEIVLRMITDAEIDFNDWEQSGKIKRSQVIEEIYAKYPILAKAKSQKEVVDFIDTQIDNALKELRSVIEKNIKMGNIQ